jgi:hypothetical protein
VIVTAPPTTSARLLRTRLLLIRVGAGLLTLQLLLNAAAGPVAIASGRVPRTLLLAALLAPLGKLLALGAIAAVAWTAGRSPTAVRLWLLGLVAEIVASLAARQPSDALAVLLQLLLFGGLLVLLIPDRRSLLPTAPRYQVRFAPAAVLGAIGGVWIAATTATAVGTAPGVTAEDLAELRFDMALLGAALLAWSLLSGLLGRSRLWIVPATAALVTAVTFLALPHRWADPGALAAALLLGSAVATAIAGTRPAAPGATRV